MAKRKIKKTLLIFIGLYIMIGTSLYLIQEKILFRPTVLAQDYVYDFNQPFEELFLKPDGNTIINAIHFKAEKPKGVILYFHGNAGDLSRWGLITEYFVEKEYDVLVMDYRSYGKSVGTLSEDALYTDAQFCFDYLKAQYSEDDITLYGRSLGTGIASYVASKNNPKRLILETPYYSILDVASYRFPLFPVKYLLRYKLPSHEFIEAVNCPVSIIHGTDDNVVPFESGKKLYESAIKENTTFIVIDNGKHNNLIEFDAYHEHINSVLR